MIPIIHVRNLRKTFSTSQSEKICALVDINLEIQKNDFVCIVGPSGCGKSTLLRIIAGLEKATSGEVSYQGELISCPGRERGMVFQEYSLFPWRNILDNIGLGLEFAGKSTEEKQQKSMEYLKLVGLEKFGKAFPHELSGGMRQRAAIARALANDPEVLLMDEPFGALDAHTRILLQQELLRIWEAHKKTILFVTHSVDEAVFLSDKIVLMSARPGEIKRIININIPRPRKRSDPTFGTLTYEILNMLNKEIVLQ
ncbi:MULTISPECIES: ABC transporter ATP-binding protein [Aminobacterium]|jgi:ABC-type nitrate/sulfonate/bicarbonate transport system ATPase subunit|uniref:ABC transporter ATP-binding protein n=1 Tax=Aminobacterium TaxID=81466 RepID=UPI000467841A|nr:MULTISPECIES: ABC transporter ATP-binding protein [Aminobacterium]